MSSKAALVTGANGFVGARLVRKLVERGEKVKALVRAGSDLRELVGLPPEQVKIAVGDIRMCDRVFAGLSGCDRLYHVAATYSINEKNRKEMIDDAILGATSTLEAARRAGIEKIVFTSSVATLGVTRDPSQLLTEDASFNLERPNGYAESKLAAERVALRAAEAGAPVVIVSPSMIVGPGDWKPTPTGAQIVNYLKHSPGFRVPCPPGGFSYVDVEDVASGLILAMEKGRTGERYILGGENLQNRQMLQLLADVTGLAEPGDDLTRGKADMMASMAELLAWWMGTPPLLTRKVMDDYFGAYVFVSSEKAKKELGFQTRPARQAFISACRWYLDNGYIPERAARRARLELQPS
jgi:dihydroflavonol-4-reductase